MNIKMVAVGTVVVLAITSVGAILLFTDMAEKDYRSEDLTGRLRIMGNVNNDDYLDDEDLALYEKIISGEESSDNYPLADANQDGIVDEKDRDMVKRMLKREPMRMNYVNGYGKTASFSYPLNNIVSVDRCTPQIQCIGASEKITGLTIKDDIRFPELNDVPNIGRAQQQINMEEISKITVAAVIVMSEPKYVTDEPDLLKAKIDVIRVSYDDMSSELSWAITLGFMLNCESKAEKFVKWCDDILRNIREKTDNLGEDGRKTTLMGYSRYVAGIHTSYAEVSKLSGGNNLADFEEKSKKIEDGSEFILDEKYQAEYMIWSKTMGYTHLSSEKMRDEYLAGMRYVDKTRAYGNGKGLVVNGSMQMICRIAYIAGELYPDLFGADYGDKMHQEYINDFCGIEYDVSKGPFLLRKADVGV